LMSKKIQQFTLILTCKCVGRPSSGTTEVLNKGGRIKCKKTIVIPISKSGPTALHSSVIKRETAPFLDDAGWKKLKTLGYFQRLCPSCSDYVLKQRARDKEQWG